MMESDILYAATESLEKLTHAHIKVDQRAQINGHQWDALIDIRSGKATGQFLVEVKMNVTPAHLAPLMDKLKNREGLLVSKRFTSSVQKMLEGEGVNFLDVAGNCLIQNDKGLFFRIKGERMPEEFKEIKHKAFSKNGIKLIYGLLLEEDLFNRSYRTMAAKTAISGSTVGSVLEDLSKSNYLYQQNEDTRLLVNKEELLKQWVTAYNQKLRPKLKRGKYRFLNKSKNWKDLNLGLDAFWGGEPAAEILTKFLYPELFTIYTNLDRKALINNLGLMPDRKGNVEVLQFFWNEEANGFTNRDLKVVSPLLVYADLVGSANSRNLEVANRIYEQYLKNIIE